MMDCKNGMPGQPPARSELAALFEFILRHLRPDLQIERQAYTREYAGGVFEAHGKRWRLIIVPETTDVSVLHRKEVADVR
jgi:hypothetical protein